MTSRPMAVFAAGAGLLVTLAVWNLWEYLWEGEYLGRWASLVTIFSLLLAPFWYFLRRELEDRGEKSRASANLYMELANARNGLENTQDGDLTKVDLGDGERTCFMNRMLNHGFYDGLVSSGMINFVKPGLQQDMQDVFQRIKDHNLFLKKIRDLEGTPGCDAASRQYYLRLGETDLMLTKIIPPVMERLKREYRLRDSGAGTGRGSLR